MYKTMIGWGETLEKIDEQLRAEAKSLERPGKKQRLAELAQAYRAVHHVLGR